MVKKKGRLRKKSKRIAKETPENDSIAKAPHSIVIHQGKVPREVKYLVRDYRKIMSPYTAEHLKVRKFNCVKDFVAVAPYFHVTHLVLFSKNETAMNMKVCRLPRGPSICFKVDEYSLVKDLTPIIRHYKTGDEYFYHHSLLVMNNFNGAQKHLRLVSSMFQNMFPSINVTNLNVKTIKRVTLVSYDEETDQIEIRHYSIKVVPYGLSRPARKVLKMKIPDLGRYKDVSDFFINPGALSESEAEFDGEHNTVEEIQVQHRPKKEPKKEPEDVKEDIEPDTKPIMGPNQSAIRLTEMGPRLTLSLYRIETGLLDGEVLYNKFVNMTEEEKAELKAKQEEKMKLKMKRRQQQESNIKKKKLAQEALKKVQKKYQPGEDDEDFEVYNYEEANEERHVDDDGEYFREEVGKNPEKGLFPHRPKQTKRDADLSQPVAKKQKSKRGTDRSEPVAKNPKTDGQSTPRQQRKSKWKLSLQSEGRAEKSPNRNAGKSAPLNNKRFASPKQATGNKDKAGSKSSFSGMSSGSMGTFFRKKAKK